MDKKSLGQIAYETFGGGSPRDPPWPKLWMQERKWWEAAAEAVAREAYSYLNPVNRAPPTIEKMKKRDAVIEAAKAWDVDDDRHPRYAQQLMLAIEALEAAEGE